MAQKSIKPYLRSHSDDYFRPSVIVDQALLDLLQERGYIVPPYPLGSVISQFDLHVLSLTPAERIDAELKLLNYHTSKMQSTTIDLTLTDADTATTLEDRLKNLTEERKNPT